jgi:amino acid permease
MMGIYFSEGSDKLSSVISSVTNTDTTNISQYTFVSTTIFASTIAIFLATASKFGAVQTIMTKVLVPLTLLASITVIICAFPTADFESLLSSANQHPEVVLNAFPMLFMSWSSHAVVPRVVYDLEGDENKIKQAIWGGSTAALIIYLVWNAVVLGNVNIDSATNINNNLNTQLMTPTAIVSIFAVVTSLIGTILGFVNEFYDAIGTIPSQSFGPTDDNKWQVAMLTLTPPALCSIMLGYYHQLDYNSLNLDRYHIMEYTGAFGASTLFLILPALMVWQNRYGDDARPLTVKPMFPLGKITLGSLYKAAGTLIVEQGLEKLGVFEFVSNHFLLKSTPL